jgi:hypothetical protein
MHQKHHVFTGQQSLSRNIIQSIANGKKYSLFQESTQLLLKQLYLNPPTQKEEKQKHDTENINKIANRNVNGIMHIWKLEHILQFMIDNKIEAYLVQET